MTIKKQIIAYYVNAREQIKLNNPLLARKYVLMILNIVVQKYYERDISIVAKAKTAVFLDKWLAVSRDLYNNGITDYVRSCFGLIENKEKQPAAFLNQERQGARTLPAKDKSANGNIEEGAQRPVGAIDNNRDIDFSGLIDETADEQGWVAEVFESNKLAVVQISAMAANGVTAWAKSKKTRCALSATGWNSACAFCSSWTWTSKAASWTQSFCCKRRSTG